jgi:hypothetical protein
MTNFSRRSGTIAGRNGPKRNETGQLGTIGNDWGQLGTVGANSGQLQNP